MKYLKRVRIYRVQFEELPSNTLNLLYNDYLIREDKIDFEKLWSIGNIKEIIFIGYMEVDDDTPLSPMPKGDSIIIGEGKDPFYHNPDVQIVPCNADNKTINLPNMVCGTDDFEANDICALYNNIKESNKNKDNNTAAKLEFKGVKISPCIDFGSFEELIHHTWLSTFTCPKDGYVVFDIENKDIEADLLINTTHGFGDGDKICKYHFNCNDKNKLLFVKAGMKLCINITYNNNSSWEDGNNLIYYISFECSMEEDNK